MAKEIIASSHCERRQRLSEQLLDELCDGSRIDIVELKIDSDNQYHRRAGGRTIMRRLGLYKINKRLIAISNLTAVRGQIVAGKTFIDTLLHEWLHHYDTLKLGLNSIHSKGFYLRLNDLKAKLDLKNAEKKSPDRI